MPRFEWQISCPSRQIVTRQGNPIQLTLGPSSYGFGVFDIDTTYLRLVMECPVQLRLLLNGQRSATASTTLTVR